MVELRWSLDDLSLKMKVGSVLAGLPIPHKTMLKDSRVFETVANWAEMTPWSGRIYKSGSIDTSRWDLGKNNLKR